MPDADAWKEELEDLARPRVIAQGRRLFEEGKVELAGRGADEVSARVWAPGRPRPPVVTLFVDDIEWDCDCGTREDACDHAAAAVLWWMGGNVEPAAAPSLAYRLSVRRRRLVIERDWVDPDGSVRPMEGALKQGAVQGGFSPTDADLGIDRLLRFSNGAPLEVETLPRVFEWLATAPVSFEGEAIEVRARPISPTGTLDRDARGYTLRLAADPAVLEVVADGVVRVDDGLAALTHIGWSGPRLERLPAEKRYDGDAIATLVTEVMPQLRAMGVRVDGEAPQTVALPVGIELTARASGPTLEVVPRVVYGEPPHARVEHGRIVMIGSGPWPKRDEPAEHRMGRRLEARLGLKAGEPSRFTGDDALRQAARIRKEVSGDSPIHLDASSRSALERFAGRLAPRVRASGIEFVHEGGSRDGEVVDLPTVLRAWSDGEVGVLADSVGTTALPMEFLHTHADALRLFVRAREADGSLAAYAGPALLAVCEAIDVPPPPSLDPLRALLDGSDGPPIARPADLVATLRPYQSVGVDWLALLGAAGLGAMLCDDMGLGKTLQALAGMTTPALVVCPTSVLPNWREEARRFRPGLRVCAYHGRERALDPEADLTLTTYGVLRLDIDRLEQQMWGSVVLDEAQTIKNPDSRVARAAFRLRARSRMTLSGTPVENRLEELWSQAHFCNPGLLGTREEFRDQWARPIGAGDDARADGLRRRIAPFMLRRTKQAVAPELPARTEVTIHCELSTAERTLYDALAASARDEVRTLLDGGGSVISALERLLRLRQAACHPALVPGHALGEDGQATTSSKLGRLRQELETLVPAGHRALVFSQWTSLLDRVEPLLSEAGIAFTRLDGSTRDRGAVVAEFSDPDGPPVMLLSLKAGGTGLNLTAADHVYFLDPWWNPAAERQAADRAHRIGQTRPVTIRRLVARDTVDERILALQEKKRGLADAVIAAGAGLSRDELLSLLD